MDDLGAALVERGMTQAQFARSMGVSEGLVSRWVWGGRALPLRQRLRAARVLSRIDLALADPDVAAVARLAPVIPLDAHRRPHGEPRVVQALLYPDGTLRPLPDPPGGGASRMVA